MEREDPHFRRLNESLIRVTRTTEHTLFTDRGSPTTLVVFFQHLTNPVETSNFTEYHAAWERPEVVRCLTDEALDNLVRARITERYLQAISTLHDKIFAPQATETHP